MIEDLVNLFLCQRSQSAGHSAPKVLPSSRLLLRDCQMICSAQRPFLGSPSSKLLLKTFVQRACVRVGGGMHKQRFGYKSNSVTKARQHTDEVRLSLLQWQSSSSRAACPTVHGCSCCMQGQKAPRPALDAAITQAAEVPVAAARAADARRREVASKAPGASRTRL